MTIKQAFDSIVEDGIAKGAGDFVDPEALEVAAFVMAKVLRGYLVEVVRCKDCKHYDNSEGICWCNINSKFFPGGMDWHGFPEDGFCSYGERKDNGT